MLAQFFILSTRGDTIITRDFRGDLGRKTSEIFFRKVRFWKGDAPPVFVSHTNSKNVDGVNYFFTKKNAMYLVFTSETNISPAFVFDLLYQIMKVFRDFCGILSEESIRKNFVLIYEIIEEMIDFGIPQLSSTEAIKPYIVNEAVQIVTHSVAGRSFKPSIFSATMPSTAITRPMQIKQGKHKNQIFVDVLEKLNVLFNANGFVLNSSIDGCIQMKSYLSANPDLRLVLNDDLVVGKHNQLQGFHNAVLDDCNFHECVDASDFEQSKSLTIVPPDGEFVVMNYRITSEFQTPYKVFTFIDELTEYKLQFTVRVKATYPADHFSNSTILKFSVPRSTTSASFEYGKQSATNKAIFKEKEKKIEWDLKKFQGGKQFQLVSKLSLESAQATTARKEIGPVSLTFQIPMYSVSHLQVKFLKIAAAKGYNPYRWVRYVTHSNSFVCRT